jgi:hypothetical protein
MMQSHMLMGYRILIWKKLQSIPENNKEMRILLLSLLLFFKCVNALAFGHSPLPWIGFKNNTHDTVSITLVFYHQTKVLNLDYKQRQAISFYPEMFEDTSGKGIVIQISTDIRKNMYLVPKTVWNADKHRGYGEVHVV